MHSMAHNPRRHAFPFDPQCAKLEHQVLALAWNRMSRRWLPLIGAALLHGGVSCSAPNIRVQVLLPSTCQLMHRSSKATTDAC